MGTATEIIRDRPKTRDVYGILFLLILLAGFTVFSSLSIHRLPASGSISTASKAVIYGSTFVFEWILAGYVLWRLRHLGLSVRSLVRIPSTAKQWLVDIGVTVGFFLVWAAVGQGLEHLLKPGTPSFLTLLPNNWIEKAMWIILALTAGFCEELVFRGYLQQGLEACSNAAIAIVAQGVIFGLAHSYQDVKRVALIIVLGSMLGALAWWRRKLFPGMLFHAGTDILGAFLR